HLPFVEGEAGVVLAVLEARALDEGRHQVRARDVLAAEDRHALRGEDALAVAEVVLDVVAVVAFLVALRDPVAAAPFAGWTVTHVVAGRGAAGALAEDPAGGGARTVGCAVGGVAEIAFLGRRVDDTVAAPARRVGTIRAVVARVAERVAVGVLLAGV